MQNVSTVAMHSINATVPPIPETAPILLGEPANVLATSVAFIGLAIPLIFYLVWALVGVAALVYLLRRLKSP